MIIVREILKTFSCQTPLGELVAIGSDEQLYAMDFCEPGHKEKYLKRTAERLHSASLEEEQEGVLSTQLKKWLDDFFNKKLFVPFPYKAAGTHFQLAVWEVLARIPFGESYSYQEVAACMGQPKASRAVGQAIGKNPLLLLIPCHRVIRSDGSLGGFSSGIERKRWLLNHERF